MDDKITLGPEDKRAKVFFMTAVELFNAGYDEMEANYEKKNGEKGNIRIIIEDIS